MPVCWDETEVFIVGGGPAGLAAAIAARQKGLDVIVADGEAPPVEKPCGEGMMPETLSGLRSLGISVSPDEGYPFRGISFLQQNSVVSADFPQGHGIGLRRILLQNKLVGRAVEEGVKFLWNSPVMAIENGHVRLHRSSIRSRWIIGADGHGSRVRKWAGLGDSSWLRQRFATRRHYQVRPWTPFVELYWGDVAQAYVTPVSSSEVCVVIMAASRQAADFQTALQQFPALQDKLSGAVISDRQRGAVTAMHSLRNVVGGNVALIGDASGAVDAVTGEGLRLAFEQAQILADSLGAGHLRSYKQGHRLLLRRPWFMGQLMLVLARHAKLRDRVFSAFRSRPELFAHLLAMHVGRSNLKEFMTTALHLGTLVGVRRFTDPKGSLS